MTGGSVLTCVCFSPNFFIFCHIFVIIPNYRCATTAPTLEIIKQWPPHEHNQYSAGYHVFMKQVFFTAFWRQTSLAAYTTAELVTFSDAGYDPN